MFVPAAAYPLPLDLKLARGVGLVTRWLRANRGSVAMAALLAFAGPVTFLAGALSVMRAPTALAVALLCMWWALYGVSLWCLLLIAGYGCERLVRPFGRYVRGSAWLLVACSASAFANLATAGRAAVLIEQGLVTSAWTMQVHGFVISLVMTLLYFAHLRRSREHEQAASRLASAQAAQRDARRRVIQARLQEVQARIDPQMLFDMLDTVRRLYERDAARAEHFLDELIVFLRAALPRLRTVWSSLLREVELASAFASLHAIAGTAGLEMKVEVAPDAMHARFPPGVLLPLVDVAAGAYPRRLSASRTGDDCRLILTSGASPSDGSISRVRSLLAELYGTSATLRIETRSDAIDVIVTVPYELA